MKITRDIDLVLREVTALTPREQVFVLVDEHTREFCLPTVQQTLALPDEQICCIASGEAHKTLETVETIWTFLQGREATRHSLLLCLGGGVVTDLGGFAAATYKRGMTWVNLPTTLLGMVDAAAGGKTGFNYGGLKNGIGLIREARETIVYVPFLETLPARELLSGWAEMVKHALISSPLEVARVRAFDLDGVLGAHTPSPLRTPPTLGGELSDFEELIRRSVEIKGYIVEQDPEETGMRQTLNFGHTIGHALEEFSLRHDAEPMLHGYAVMYGMIAELYLSQCMREGSNGSKGSFLTDDRQSRTEKFEEISWLVEMVKTYYGKPVCACKEYDELIALMRQDKKNTTPDGITFTLLRTVGNYVTGCHVKEEQIKEALDFLFNC